MRGCWAFSLLLLLLASGCAPLRVIRLETGGGSPVVVVPHAGVSQPVRVEAGELRAAWVELSRSVMPSDNPQRAAQRLFDMGERGGSYVFDVRTRRLTPLGAGSLPPETDAALTREYLQWCANRGRAGDCLRLLVNQPTVDGEGRYLLAMALAHEAVLDEMLASFRGMVHPQALLSAALWTGTMYLLLWTVPEPTSKGLAAVMTATLIIYLGIDPFWNLITGFRQLVEESDRALSFGELREAGERYGRVMGSEAARAFVMLATAAIGNTAAGFAARVPTLPGSAQASMQAAGRAGLVLSAVGEVRAAAVSGGAITLTLAPGAVAAMMGGSPDTEGHDHHIATNKWWNSLSNGGPWSPQFQQIFDRAGMSLDDPANIVRVKAHQGPHPEEYHQQVFDRLFAVTRGCRTMSQCRAVLTAELERLARQISTVGSDLNKLVTRTK